MRCTAHRLAASEKPFYTNVRSGAGLASAASHDLQVVDDDFLSRIQYLTGNDRLFHMQLRVKHDEISIQAGRDLPLAIG